jgi:hypothetical protein
MPAPSVSSGAPPIEATASTRKRASGAVSRSRAPIASTGVRVPDGVSQCTIVTSVGR